MAVQQIGKGTSQYALSIAATVFKARGSAQYSLPNVIQWQAVGNAQYDLPAIAQQVGTGSAQYQLSIFKQWRGTGTDQYALSGWKQSISKGTSQYALTAWKQNIGTGSAQHNLSIYQTFQATGNAQHALNVYVTSIGIGSAQYSTDVSRQQIALGTAQWLLDTTTKYYGYALNLTTGALSKLDDFEFNSLSGDMGADSNGIYTLTGITNNGVAIPAFIETGYSDFNDPNLKHIFDSYTDYKGGALKLTVITDNGEVHYTLPITTKLKTIKRLVARGVRGRYWKFRLENVAGSSANVEGLSLDMQVTRRKM